MIPDLQKIKNKKRNQGRMTIRFRSSRARRITEQLRYKTDMSISRMFENWIIEKFGEQNPNAFIEHLKLELGELEQRREAQVNDINQYYKVRITNIVEKIEELKIKKIVEHEQRN